MDKRILKNPLSGFDTDEVNRCFYTSKKGYFGSFVDDFDDISQLEFGTLRCVEDGLFLGVEKSFIHSFYPKIM